MSAYGDNSLLALIEGKNEPTRWMSGTTIMILLLILKLVVKNV